MRTLILISLAFAMLTHHSSDSTINIESCSASNVALEVIQENGDVIKLNGIGNALLNYAETIDGYTVIKENGNYEYAKLGSDGKIKGSGVIAKNPDTRNETEVNFLKNKEKHLRISENAKKNLLSNYEGKLEHSHETNHFPSNGSQKVLVIMIEYPDLPHTYSKSDFNELMNQPNYKNTGSFRDFYLKNSQGNLDLNVDVFGWYTSQHNYAHYGNLNGIGVAMDLAGEAIDAAQATGIDFSNYDNDNDGKVDGVVIVHAGPGAEVGAQNQYIWSQRNKLYNEDVRNYDGVVIEDFILNPETRPWGMVGIGIFCHEFGHLLGLPDLYDLDNSSAGIGNWGLMGKGSWLNHENTPANLCAWAKEKYNWIEPTVITEGYYSLTEADFTDACYRINTPDPSEYFLLENKQKVGNDAYLPGEGLAIWHIDTDKTNLYPTSNYVNLNETNKGVDLEEADGIIDLDINQGNGNSGDLFPGNSNAITFNEQSIPNSNTYFSGTSDIAINNINVIGSLVSFVLNGDGNIPCEINSVSDGVISSCNSGSYDLEVTVNYNYPIIGDKLQVNGVEFDLTGSPQKVILEDLPSNGEVVALSVSIGEQSNCVYQNSNFIQAPKSYEINLYQTTCEPNDAGIYADYLTSSSGCDSIIIVHKELLESSTTVINQETCEESLATTETFVYAMENGCDSTIIVNTEFVGLKTDFGYNVNGLEVNFTNYSENADEFIWSFGDDNVSYEMNPTYEYNSKGAYKVVLEALKSDCTLEAKDSVTIQVGTITGIDDEELLRNTTNVYPNPTMGIVNIDFKEKFQSEVQAQIINLQGVVVMKTSFKNSKNTIDLSNIAKGAYYLELEIAGEKEIQKVVKL